MWCYWKGKYNSVFLFLWKFKPRKQIQGFQKVFTGISLSICWISLEPQPQYEKNNFKTYISILAIVNYQNLLNASPLLKKELKAKSIRASKVSAIVLQYIGVDSIHIDPAVPAIFYFKHHVGAYLIKIFYLQPWLFNVVA